MECEGNTLYFYQKEEDFVVLFETFLGDYTVKGRLKGVV